MPEYVGKFKELIHDVDMDSFLAAIDGFDEPRLVDLRDELELKLTQVKAKKQALLEDLEIGIVSGERDKAIDRLKSLRSAETWISMKLKAVNQRLTNRLAVEFQAAAGIQPKGG